MEKEYRIKIVGTKESANKVISENPGAVNMGFGNWGLQTGYKIEIPIPETIARNRKRREVIKKIDGV